MPDSQHDDSVLAQPEATIALTDRPPITYDAAINTDANIILEAQHVAAKKALDREIWSAMPSIGALVKHHLGLGDDIDCFVARKNKWIRGGFNVCVPVKVRAPSGPPLRLMLRCAMAHKLAEAHNPGSVDEKMSSEVGAYAWMQEHCADIRIPHLYGFGFSDQRHVRPPLIDPLAPEFWLTITSYSSLTKGTVLSGHESFIACGALSTPSSDARPSSRAIPAIRPATVCPPHTCCSRTSGPPTANCCPLRGTNTVGTPSERKTYTEAWRK